MKKKMICAVLIGSMVIHGSGISVKAGSLEPTALWRFWSSSFPVWGNSEKNMEENPKENQKECIRDEELKELVQKKMKEFCELYESDERIHSNQETGKEALEKLLESIREQYPDEEIEFELPKEEELTEEQRRIWNCAKELAGSWSEKMESGESAGEEQSEETGGSKTIQEEDGTENKEPVKVLGLETETPSEEPSEIRTETNQDTEEEIPSETCTETPSEISSEIPSEDLPVEESEFFSDEEKTADYETEDQTENMMLSTEEESDEIVIPVRKTPAEIIGAGKEQLLMEIVPELPRVRLVYDNAEKVTSEYQPVIRMENSDKAEIVSCMINGVEADYHWEENEIFVSPEGLMEGNNRITVMVKDKTGEICEMEPWEFQVEEEELLAASKVQDQGTEKQEEASVKKSWFGRYLDILGKLLMCTFHRGIFF
ncbi:MAG: hypothetical protein ACI4EG_13830 [Fusicatenibacter sp.]